MYKFEQYLPKEIIKKGAELKDYTTFGIGGKCSAVLLPRNKKELVDCVRVCKKYSAKFQVIGNGSNILAPTRRTRRVYIVTTNMEKSFSLHETFVNVSAGIMISELILWCKEHGLAGLESLFGIPATVGGAIMMNAGAFGQEVFDCLEAIEVYHEGKIRIITKDQIGFSHHKTSLLTTSMIILSAEFVFKRLASSVISSKIKEIVFKRSTSQPKGKSAGCVFRAVQDIPAGRLIDEAGLKNTRIGGAIISEKHANFIINECFATDEDVKKLVKYIQKIIKQKNKITLEREIEYIGDRDGYYR